MLCRRDGRKKSPGERPAHTHSRQVKSGSCTVSLQGLLSREISFFSYNVQYFCSPPLFSVFTPPYSDLNDVSVSDQCCRGNLKEKRVTWMMKTFLPSRCTLLFFPKTVQAIRPPFTMRKQSSRPPSINFYMRKNKIKIKIKESSLFFWSCVR